MYMHNWLSNVKSLFSLQNFGTLTDKQGNVYRSYSSAYMLVYIRESCLGTVLKPITLDDIPECLVSRLREEKRIEANHRKARAELSNSTTLVLILDEDFYGWQVSHMPLNGTCLLACMSEILIFSSPRDLTCAILRQYHLGASTFPRMLRIMRFSVMWLRFCELTPLISVSGV